MSLQEEYNYMQSGQWSEIDPTLCDCHGGGWVLSDLDTWHKCYYHYNKDLCHPEDEYHYEASEEERKIDQFNQFNLWKNHYIKKCEEACEEYVKHTSDKGRSKLTVFLKDNFKEEKNFSDYCKIRNYYTIYLKMVRDCIESYNNEVDYLFDHTGYRKKVYSIEDKEKVILDFEDYCTGKDQYEDTE